MKLLKIGVISDTHIPSRAKTLPPEIFEIFDGVDLILHAGDVAQEKVLTELSAIAPIEAVAGNMDPLELRRVLGVKKLLTLEELRIGLTHGEGQRGSTPQRAYQTFLEDEPHCVVFGHSHQPYNKIHKGVLLFNPGSPTDKRRENHYSCGLIEINDNKIVGKIIYLKDKKLFAFQR